MSLRTFVSFEATAPKDGQPPGRELAEALAGALRAEGQDVRGPDEYEGWAWTMGRKFEGGGIFSLVGLTDDPPREWQVHSYAQRTRPRLFGGPKVERLDDEMRGWCRSIDDALRSIDDVRSIRWYEQSRFEVDHGETWFDSPTD